MPFRALPFWCEAHDLRILRIRWEGNKAIADVGREEDVRAMKNQEMAKAEAGLKAAIAVYNGLYRGDKSPQQRIIDGEAYVRAHPEDRAAPAQLAKLRRAERAAAYQIIEATADYDAARGDAPMDAEIAVFLGSVA